MIQNSRSPLKSTTTRELAPSPPPGPMHAADKVDRPRPVQIVSGEEDTSPPVRDGGPETFEVLLIGCVRWPFGARHNVKIMLGTHTRRYLHRQHLIRKE